MKKIMIAAAAAALIGGAEAATNVYQFVANLQTTTGAKSSAVTTYTAGAANFGAKSSTSASASWWYKDTKVLKDVDATAYPVYTWKNTAADYLTNDLVWTTHWAGGVTEVPALQIKNAVISKETALWLTQLSADYQTMSAGQWCCSLVWTVQDGQGAGCYRVVGANYINQEIELVDNCCTVTKSFTLADGKKVVDFSATPAFLNRFGGRDAAASVCIETYASVDNLTTAIGNLPFKGWLAGQGFWQTVNNKKTPVQVTGSIVGYTTPSLCEYCCWDPAETDAYVCLDDDNAPTTKPNTAAYGTFYIQYLSTK